MPGATAQRLSQELGFVSPPDYSAAMPQDIRSQTRDELAAQLKAWGQPAYRAEQVLRWLYRRRATDWAAMTNLPRALRDQLREQFGLHPIALVRRQGAADATQKFLWRLNDGALIESVLIPANPALYGEASDRHTLCVSTQVGCAYGCKFCASGLEGWKRDLRVEEIVDQVLAAERAQPGRGARPGADAPTANPQGSVEPPRPEGRDAFHCVPDFSGNDGDAVERVPTGFMGDEQVRQDLADSQEPARGRSPAAAQQTEAPTGDRSRAVPPRFIDNLVIMGMGEPLANYDALLKALTILNAPWGGGIGARKITISTSGLVPQIRQLAQEPFQFRLALSLHGATDATRNRIMPVNRKYPLPELIAACEYYLEKKGRMITLEYILIAGVNDAVAQTAPLAQLAHRLHAKVNLIPYNPVEGLPWKRPDEAIQEAFLAALTRQHVSATLRREKGGDIDAACGQLRLKTERELRRQG